MRRPFFFLWVLVLPLLSLAAGCGTGLWPSSADDAKSARSGGVAVVDLDEVARQLGLDVAMSKDFTDGQTSLAKQLQTLQTTLKEKYHQKSIELDPRSVTDATAAAARKEQLAQFERELNLQLNQAQRTAQKELSDYRLRLVQRFRDEVVPMAQQAAAERGLGVVLTKNDTVLLTFDDAHDITAAVVAKLRAHRVAAAASSSTEQRR